MITLALFVTFIAYYLWYHTSNKVVLVSSLGIESLVKKHKTPSKLIGCGLWLLALLIFIYLYGIGAGSLFFFITLMTLGSLVFILYPLNLMTYRTLICALALSAILEYLNI